MSLEDPVVTTDRPKDQTTTVTPQGDGPEGKVDGVKLEVPGDPKTNTDQQQTQANTKPDVAPPQSTQAPTQHAKGGKGHKGATPGGDGEGSDEQTTSNGPDTGGQQQGSGAPASLEGMLEKLVMAVIMDMIPHVPQQGAGPQQIDSSMPPAPTASIAPLLTRGGGRDGVA